MPLIPAGTLKKICPALNQKRAAIIEGYINTICPLYGINTGNILHEFLANVLEESNCFLTYEESLNYSTEALLKTFSRARISEEDAIKFGRSEGHPANQRKLGNILYGGEWGKVNLGNTGDDDGYNLRGSGPIQLTGRDMFTKFAAYMRTKNNINKTPEEWADVLRTSDEYGIHSASWFFAIAKNLIPLAITDKMQEIVKKINGGFNGLTVRLKYYELCKQLIPA